MHRLIQKDILMKPRMNVYITTSKKNLKYAYVAIKSLFEKNTDSEVYLYIVSEDLEENDVINERNLAGELGHRIIILLFDEKVAEKQIILGDKNHWPLATLACYWLFHDLLPNDVERIIMLESDVLVMGSLREMYDADMHGCYAACPGPEHKPVRHRELMKKYGGDTLTFVGSVYDVEKIRNDFTLQDILKVNAEANKKFGFSQQELTFGLLFAGKIKYFPGKESCIEENSQAIKEWGYDYIVQCEKQCKLLHFSSRSDHGKPWNPVSIMPGYYFWWQEAKDSPYYKQYFEEQWILYDRVVLEKKQIEKNISYRNILLITIVIGVLLMCASVILFKLPIYSILIVYSALILAFCITILLRQVSILWSRKKGHR